MCRSPVKEQLSNSESSVLVLGRQSRAKTDASIFEREGGGINLSFRSFGKTRGYIGIHAEGRKIAVACRMEQSRDSREGRGPQNMFLDLRWAAKYSYHYVCVLLQA